MQIIGLEFDGNHLIAAQVRKKKNSFVPFHLQIIPLVQKKNVKQLYMKHFSKTIPTVVGLPGSEVLLKHITLKATQKKTIAKTLPFQLESQCFLDPTTSVTAPLIEIEDGEANVHCFITTKAILEETIDHAVVEPEYISCHAMALVRFATHLFPDTRSSFILHLGQNSCTCVLMIDNLPKAFHLIPIGVNHLLEVLKEEKSKIDLLAPNKNYSQAIFFKEAQKLKNEVAKTIFALLETHAITTKSLPILFTGFGNHILHLEEFLASGSIDCFSSALAYDKKGLELKPYAISIGLAYDVLSNDYKSIQFRQGDYQSLKRKRKIAWHALFFLLLSTFLSLGLYYYGKERLDNDFKKLKEQIDLALIHDNSYMQRPLKADQNLSPQVKLSKWQKVLQKENKPLSYAAKFPIVTDVFYWLSNHPLLKGEVKLDHFHYELVKYPKLESPNDPYLAKVTLELNIPSADLARKFHESLSNADSFINSKLDISWEVVDQIYKTSFYLNNNFYDQKAS